MRFNTSYIFFHAAVKWFEFCETNKLHLYVFDIQVIVINVVVVVSLLFIAVKMLEIENLPKNDSGVFSFSLSHCWIRWICVLIVSPKCVKNTKHKRHWIDVKLLHKYKIMMAFFNSTNFVLVMHNAHGFVMFNVRC